MAKTDRQLIAEAKRGAEDAYRALVERYQRPVFGLLLRIVRDRGWAEDLAQETFIKAFRALDSFQVERKFSSWLFKIAHNSAIDALRRRRLDTVPLETAGDDSPDLLGYLEDSGASSPESELRGRSIGEDLGAAMEQIRPDYRSVIQLRFIEGLSYDEIAQVMDLPLGTVKTHLHRARKQLSQSMIARGWGRDGE